MEKLVRQKKELLEELQMLEQLTNNLEKIVTETKRRVERKETLIKELKELVDTAKEKV